MSDNLKSKAEAFRAKQMAAQGQQADDDAQILDISESVEQAKQAALATNTTPQTTPIAAQQPAPTRKVTAPKAANQTAKKVRRSEQTRGSFTFKLPVDLYNALNNNAERHDLWTVEYIRAAIEEYAPQITKIPDGTRRRRSRTPSTHPTRTYHLGDQAKTQLQRAADRTNRSQTSVLIEIIKRATSDEFAPAFAD